MDWRIEIPADCVCLVVVISAPFGPVVVMGEWCVDLDLVPILSKKPVLLHVVVENKTEEEESDSAAFSFSFAGPSIY